MKLKYLLIIGLLAIGCKNGEALGPQDASNPPGEGRPVNAEAPKPEPTFSQCAEAGWNRTKEAGLDAYEAGVKAYQEWKAAHPDAEEPGAGKPTSEP